MENDPHGRQAGAGRGDSLLAQVSHLYGNLFPQARVSSSRHEEELRYPVVGWVRGCLEWRGYPLQSAVAFCSTAHQELSRGKKRWARVVGWETDRAAGCRMGDRGSGPARRGRRLHSPHVALLCWWDGEKNPEDRVVGVRHASQQNVAELTAEEVPAEPTLRL